MRSEAPKASLASFKSPTCTALVAKLSKIPQESLTVLFRERSEPFAYSCRVPSTSRRLQPILCDRLLWKAVGTPLVILGINNTDSCRLQDGAPCAYLFYGRRCMKRVDLNMSGAAALASSSSESLVTSADNAWIKVATLARKNARRASDDLPARIASMYF